MPFWAIGAAFEVARLLRILRVEPPQTGGVLYDVDESIRELLRAQCGLANEIEVVFDAPTRDWAARRSGPAVDVFLYDIRENLERRQNLTEMVRWHCKQRLMAIESIVVKSCLMNVLLNYV